MFTFYRLSPRLPRKTFQVPRRHLVTMPTIMSGAISRRLGISCYSTIRS